MAKYYFSELDDERCYELSDIYDQAEGEGWKEVEVWEAERDVRVSWFWCRFVDEPGERGECPGCADYSPRNGKNGICKHWGYTYSKKGESFKLKIK